MGDGREGEPPQGRGEVTGPSWAGLTSGAQLDSGQRAALARLRRNRLTTSVRHAPAQRLWLVGCAALWTASALPWPVGWRPPSGAVTWLAASNPVSAPHPVVLTVLAAVGVCARVGANGWRPDIRWLTVPILTGLLVVAWTVTGVVPASAGGPVVSALAVAAMVAACVVPSAAWERVAQVAADTAATSGVRWEPPPTVTGALVALAVLATTALVAPAWVVDGGEVGVGVERWIDLRPMVAAAAGLGWCVAAAAWVIGRTRVGVIAAALTAAGAGASLTLAATLGTTPTPPEAVSTVGPILAATVAVGLLAVVARPSIGTGVGLIVALGIAGLVAVVPTPEPGGDGWQRIVGGDGPLRPGVRADTVAVSGGSSSAVLPDGQVVVADRGRLWHVDRDGHTRHIPGPDDISSFDALWVVGHDRVVISGRPHVAVRVTDGVPALEEVTGLSEQILAATPDGDVVVRRDGRLEAARVPAEGPVTLEAVQPFPADADLADLRALGLADGGLWTRSADHRAELLRDGEITATVFAAASPGCGLTADPERSWAGRVTALAEDGDRTWFAVSAPGQERAQIVAVEDGRASALAVPAEWVWHMAVLDDGALAVGVQDAVLRHDDPTSALVTLDAPSSECDVPAAAVDPVPIVGEVPHPDGADPADLFAPLSVDGTSWLVVEDEALVVRVFDATTTLVDFDSDETLTVLARPDGRGGAWVVSGQITGDSVDVAHWSDDLTERRVTQAVPVDGRAELVGVGDDGSLLMASLRASAVRIDVATLQPTDLGVVVDPASTAAAVGGGVFVGTGGSGQVGAVEIIEDGARTPVLGGRLGPEDADLAIEIERGTVLADLPLGNPDVVAAPDGGLWVADQGLLVHWDLGETVTVVGELGQRGLQVLDGTVLNARLGDERWEQLEVAP